MRNRRGVSLLELMVVAVLISAVFISASLLFPKTMRSMFGEQRRWGATNMATNRLQEIKSIPYPLLQLTETGAGYFSDEVDTVISPGGCDCRTVDFDDITKRPPPYSDVVQFQGKEYLRQVCLNRMDRNAGAWRARCPAVVDVGLISIRIRVSWVSENNQRTFIEAETMATRL